MSILFATLAAALTQATSTLDEPTLLRSVSGLIDVEVGHAAPLHLDWDGDGTRDLLVGQFGEGRLWIHRNIGTDTTPVFEDGVAFRAGGTFGTVPTG